MKQALLLIIPFILLSIPLRGGPFVDLETGPVFTGYNDVRIPGRWGTRFSLPGVLGNEPWYFIRARAGWTIKEQHSLYLLAAPLQINYEGMSPKFIIFKNRLFFPCTPIRGTFKFNSWRLSYRYDIVKNDTIQFGLGLTGKIRDAYIRLDSLNRKTTRSDLGFVPLIAIRLQWMFIPGFSFLIDADWLVGPQGRAEDIVVAFQYHINKNILLKAGYRILEGGADNSKVYTFSLFHYAVLGTTITF